MAIHELKRTLFHNAGDSSIRHDTRLHRQDMSDYHEPLMRMHHAELHGWGIAMGLEVTKTGDQQLTIAQGLAIDRQGRLLPLAATGYTGQPGQAFVHTTATPPVLVPVVVPTGASATEGPHYVTLELPTTAGPLGEPVEGRWLPPPTGVDRKGWIISTPLLKLQPTASFDPQGPALILATVTLGAGGVVTSLSRADRQYVRLAAGEVVVRQGVQIGTDDPEGGDTVSGRIGPLAGGGLQVAVPQESHTVVLHQADGRNFEALTVRANLLHVIGHLEVVRDITVAGTVDGRDVSADGQKLDSHVGITNGNPHGTTAVQVGALPLTGGTLTGNLAVSGTVDGRDVSADGQKLDSHVGITNGNPHGTTAVQVGALPLTGGTLTGNLAVSGTVDGRDVSADGQKLDSHVGITNGNPHGTTAVQVGALPLTGGTLTGNLAVSGVVKLHQGTAINEFSSDGKLAGNSDAAVPTERAVKEYIDNLLLGCVAAFATTTPPPGWLECNGQAISRTQYARLFAQISTTFGPGDGSTTFNVPDLRGLVIRGWDHGRGLDSGRNFGSYQHDAFQEHQHSFSGTSASISGGWHSHEALNAGFYQHVKLSGGGNAEVRQYGNGHTWSAEHAHAYTPLGSVGNANGNRSSETRIKNQALMYCIKS